MWKTSSLTGSSPPRTSTRTCDVEKAALLVKRADLVGEVRRRSVRLGVERQGGREHVGVVVLVAVESRQEAAARVDADAQVDVPAPAGETTQTRSCETLAR